MSEEVFLGVSTVILDSLYNIEHNTFTKKRE